MTEPDPRTLGDGGLVRLRLDLAYDGTDFSGWAAQPGRRTVQGELEEALATVLRLPEPASLTVRRPHRRRRARPRSGGARRPAGRALVRRTATRRAPHELLVRSPAQRRAGATCGCRRSPRRPTASTPGSRRCRRRYAYRVCDRRRPADPLRRHDALLARAPLDVDGDERRGGAAARRARLRRVLPRREGATTIRGLLSADLGARRRRRCVVATVVADAFCHSMVRALVGALLAVGEGRRGVDWPARVLAGGVRDPGVPVVPAHGLTLEEVRYPGDEELAQRAQQTRARRVPAVAPPAP